jgi:serine/threonine-protein kinase
MAPEAIRGAPATPATDIYALGCLLYECVTGGPPFAGLGFFQVGIAHLDEPPPDPSSRRPGLPARFSGAMLLALEKEPARRPASAGAYVAALLAAAEVAPR